VDGRHRVMLVGSAAGLGWAVVRRAVVGRDGRAAAVCLWKDLPTTSLCVIVETWSDRGCWLIESSVTVAGGHAVMIFSFARGRASRKVSIGVLPKHQRP